MRTWGNVIRITEIPFPEPRLYIILAPYQVRITPRRARGVVPCDKLTPYRATHVLLEIETSALVRRRNSVVPCDHFAGQASTSDPRDERFIASAMRCTGA